MDNPDGGLLESRRFPGRPAPSEGLYEPNGCNDVLTLALGELSLLLKAASVGI